MKVQVSEHNKPTLVSEGRRTRPRTIASPLRIDCLHTILNCRRHKASSKASPLSCVVHPRPSPSNSDAFVSVFFPLHLLKRRTGTRDALGERVNSSGLKAVLLARLEESLESEGGGENQGGRGGAGRGATRDGRGRKRGPGERSDSEPESAPALQRSRAHLRRRRRNNTRNQARRPKKAN